MLTARLAIVPRLAALLALGATAHAQCVDWYPGSAASDLNATGGIQDMVVHDPGTGPRIYAGGQFTTAGGVSVGNVAAWNGSAWESLGANLTGGYDYPQCSSLTWFDDGTGSKLYVGGAFTQAGGQPAAHIACWNGTSWSGVGGGVDNMVEALAVYDDGTGSALYAAGHFLNAGGQSANRIARWNGTSWSTLGTGLNSYVLDFGVVDDGTGSKLFVMGNFTQANGISVNRFATWSSAGWTPRTGPSGSRPVCVAEYDEGSGPQLWAANFERISRWNGTSWTQFATISGPDPDCLVVLDDGTGPALFVGGRFNLINGQPAYRIAKYLGGGAWTSLGYGAQPGLQGNGVRDCVTFDSGAGPELHVGGSFSSAGYWTARSFARYGAPCTAPVVVQDPANLTAAFPSTASFDVQAVGTPTLLYQWRKDGVDLVNAPNHIEGATTNHLVIWDWSFADAGIYDCVVGNPIGFTFSQPAQLTVPAGGVTGTPVVLSLVAVKNDPVPGAPPGTLYVQPIGADQADDGTIAFTSSVTGLGRALCMWDGVSTNMLHYEGEQAPGAPSGILFGVPSGGAFGDTFAGTGGQVAFRSNVKGPGVDAMNNSGIWHRNATSTVLVTRMGEPAPDGPAGSLVGEIETTRFAESGRILYRDRTVTSSGSYLYRSLRAWDRTTGMVEIFRQNTPAPGTSANFFAFQNFFMNRVGTILCSASLSDGTDGLWIGEPGAMQLFLLSTDPAPGLPAGNQIGGAGNLTVNDLGELAFESMTGPPGGPWVRSLYRWTPTSGFELLLRAGDAPPSGFSEPWVAAEPICLSNDGKLLFQGSFFGGCSGCATRTLWLLDSTGMQLVARNHATPLPEIPAAWTFGAFQNGAVNESGQVVFGTLHYFGSGINSVFGWTQGSGLFPIAVPGTQLELHAGEYRTVTGASFAPGPSSSAPERAKNLSSTGRVGLNIGSWSGAGGIFQGQFQQLAALYAPAPAILVDPADQRVEAGQAVEFSTEATGLDPLAYQWRKDGVDLADGVAITGAQTPTLSLFPAQETDAGSYTVFVSNSYGFAESAAAVLRVEPGDSFCAGDDLDPLVITDCPCSNFGATGHGCANSINPAGGVLTATGTTNPDTVVLAAAAMPLTVSAIYLKGDAHDAAGSVFGDGVRCVDGSLIRMRTKQNAGGASQFPEPGDPSVSTRGQTPPGSGLTGWYQVYYRNAAAAFCPPATFNITNGYTIVW